VLYFAAADDVAATPATAAACWYVKQCCYDVNVTDKRRQLHNNSIDSGFYLGPCYNNNNNNAGFV